jgi:DNA helicase-2/ATP-dependent DNA helicase PcrA
VEFLDLLLERTGYKQHVLNELEDGEERWENIRELRTVAGEFTHLDPETALAALLEQVALVSEVDNLDERVDAVTFITLHAAKGLEFPVVFIVGMEEGIFPHIRSFDDPNQMEEERRLCYVGITRAKERLYLLRAFRRSLYGSSTPNPASRFIKDLPSHLVTAASFEEERAAPWPVRSMAQPIARPRATAGVYSAGERVRHGKFGEGIVVSCTPVRDDFEVVVAFRGDAGIKKLLVTYANLERVE